MERILMTVDTSLEAEVEEIWRNEDYDSVRTTTVFT
jgi:hypothetical protein